MGATYSVEEVQKDIDKLKCEVQAFDGKISSKRYSRLQKKLIQANEKILNVKESSTDSIQRTCDQLLEELNNCLEILTAKVTNKIDRYEDAHLEEERDFIKHRRKNDAKIIILNIEKEIPYIEREVENIIETKDSGRRNLMKSELRTYFKELALAKTERETDIDDRKNEIIQRLVDCYKQLINAAENINGWIQFENQFDGHFPIRDPLRLSNEPLKRLKSLYQESCDSSSTSEQDSLSTSSYISDLDYVHYDVISVKDHLNGNLKPKQETWFNKEGNESPPPLPPRPPRHKNEISQINIELEAKHVKQQVNKIDTTPSIPDNLLSYEKINSIREILMKIKENIDTFDKKYTDPEYNKIEADLLYYIDEIEKIDPQGIQSIIVSKQHHVSYIHALMDYLKERAHLIEEKSELEQTSKSEPPIIKIHPPVPKKPQVAQKPSLLYKRRSLNGSNEKNRIHPPTVAETSSRRTESVYPPVVMEENKVTENLTKSQKIFPPIVKVSTNNVNNFDKHWIGKDTKVLTNKKDKILPPVVKITETNQGRLNENQEDSESKLQTDPKSDELEKGDETFSGEADNEKDGISDALNLYLLKRLSEYDCSKNVYSSNEKFSKEDTQDDEDYIKKIEEILEDVEELKILDKFFKQTRNYKIYKDIQDILMRVIKSMVHIDPKVLSKEHMLLYEVVSKDIERFIKDV